MSSKPLSPSRAALLATAALLFAPACAESETTGADVVREAKQAAQTAGKFVSEQVAAYREQMSDKMDELAPKIDALKVQAGQLADKTKLELQQQIAQLETRRAALQERLKDAKADSSEAWDDVKQGLDQAWKELEAAMQQAAAHFQDDKQGEKKTG